MPFHTYASLLSLYVTLEPSFYFLFFWSFCGISIFHQTLAEGFSILSQTEAQVLSEFTQLAAHEEKKKSTVQAAAVAVVCVREQGLVLEHFDSNTAVLIPLK